MTKTEREIEKSAERSARKFIPIGYWAFSDGDMTALFKEPSKLKKRIGAFFGVKYLTFKEAK